MDDRKNNRGQLWVGLFWNAGFGSLSVFLARCSFGAISRKNPNTPSQGSADYSQALQIRDDRLDIFGGLPQLDPLPAVGSNHAHALQTRDDRFDIFGDLPQLDPLPAVKNCSSTAVPAVGGNMLKRTRSRQMFSACSPSVAGAVMYPVSRIGSGKVQDKTQDCRVRGGLQCGYERLTQALYVGRSSAIWRAPTITTIARRGEGQANHHNSSEGIRPWGIPRKGDRSAIKW